MRVYSVIFGDILFFSRNDEYEEAIELKKRNLVFVDEFKILTIQLECQPSTFCSKAYDIIWQIQ